MNKTSLYNGLCIVTIIGILIGFIIMLFSSENDQQVSIQLLTGFSIFCFFIGVGYPLCIYREQLKK